MKRASFYVVLEPRHTFDGKLQSIVADRMTVTRPNKLSPRHVAVKLNIDVDDRLFEQFLPEATVVISDKRELMTPQVEVDVVTTPDETAD